MSPKCSVCSDPETSENPVFYCVNCEVGVHKLCYGINVDDPVMWLCSPCTSSSSDPICELCLKNGGALKKTTCREKWVHVICALFTEGVKFQNNNRMEPVNISKIPEINHNQKCVFCKMNHGVCCKCTQLNCEYWLHITCAQNANSLLEVIEKGNKIKFQSFCIQHKPDDSPSTRRISSNFVREKIVEQSPTQLTNGYKLTFDVEDSSESANGNESINGDKSINHHNSTNVTVDLESLEVHLDNVDKKYASDVCSGYEDGTIDNQIANNNENITEVQSSISRKLFFEN